MAATNQLPQTQLHLQPITRRQQTHSWSESYQLIYFSPEYETSSKSSSPTFQQAATVLCSLTFWLNVPILHSHQPQFVSQAFVKDVLSPSPTKILDYIIWIYVWECGLVPTQQQKTLNMRNRTEQNSSWQVKDASCVKTRRVLFPAAFLIIVVYSPNRVQIIHIWNFSPFENAAWVQVLILFTAEHKKFELKHLRSVKEADETALCDTLLCLTIRGL